MARTYPSITNFLATGWKRFTRERRRAVSKAIRRAMKEPRKDLRAAFASRGVGRALWGRGAGSRKRKGQIPLMSMKSLGARWSRSQAAWTTGFHAKGMGAIIEKGGVLSTTAHVRRQNYIKRGLRSALPGVQRTIDLALRSFGREAIG
jgi:hypothetical protein